MLRYARATGRKCEDLAADLIGILTPVKSEHRAAIIEPAKIGGLLRSIEAYRGDPLTCLALKRPSVCWSPSRKAAKLVPQVIGVNLTGTWLCARAEMQQMIKQTGCLSVSVDSIRHRQCMAASRVGDKSTIAVWKARTKPGKPPSNRWARADGYGVTARSCACRMASARGVSISRR